MKNVYEFVKKIEMPNQKKQYLIQELNEIEYLFTITNIVINEELKWANITFDICEDKSGCVMISGNGTWSRMTTYHNI